MYRVAQVLCAVLAAASMANAAIITPGYTDAEKAQIVEHVNIYRRMHDAPDIAWDDDIMNDIAQPWATHLATDTSVTMVHTSSSSSPANNAEWGENLAWFQNYDHDVLQRTCPTYLYLPVRSLPSAFISHHSLTLHSLLLPPHSHSLQGPSTVSMLGTTRSSITTGTLPSPTAMEAAIVELLATSRLSSGKISRGMDLGTYYVLLFFLLDGLCLCLSLFYPCFAACLHSLTPHDTGLTIIPIHQSTQYSHYLLPCRYAHNDATRETNVNQNMQAVCNYIGEFADNVLPLNTGVYQQYDPTAEPTQAPTNAAGYTDDNSVVDDWIGVDTSVLLVDGKKGSGDIVAGILVALFLLLLLVWCQYPFLRDEMEKRPHAHTTDDPDWDEEEEEENNDDNLQLEDGKKKTTSTTRAVNKKPEGGSDDDVEKIKVTEKADKNSAKTASDVRIKGAAAHGDLYTWSEWAAIQQAATLDCFKWYGRAAVGAETECCRVLHEEDVAETGGSDSNNKDGEKGGKEAGKSAEKQIAQGAKEENSKRQGRDEGDDAASATAAAPDAAATAAAAAESPVGTCWHKFTACLHLWTRATRACFCEFWKESNEEIDHHEERKEGKSWSFRTRVSLTGCGTFYYLGVRQMFITMFKYSWFAWEAIVRAVQKCRAPKDGEAKGEYSKTSENDSNKEKEGEGSHPVSKPIKQSELQMI